MRSDLKWKLGLLAGALVVMALSAVGLWEPFTDWLIGVLDRMARPEAATASP